MEYEGVIVLAVAGILIYMSWDTYVNGKVETVKSDIDGHEYTVRSLPDKEAAADLLAEIKDRLDRLAHHLQKMYPNDDRTKAIVSKFHSDKISESADTSDKYTSYSVNKGEKIVFCLRARDDTKKLEDINMLMFVAIHELAHIATKSVGHTDEFWANMKFLLEEAINIGVYTKQDFKNNPQQYCGMTVTSSPLDNP
jgi:predicted metal-dependent hydrolase